MPAKSSALVSGWFLIAAAICANATVCIGCDLCGCYTPQLEAMPQNEEHHLFFGLYAAVAEQFTYFGTGSDRWLGPRLVASVGKLSGELAAELPISIDNTALQVVPDYRLSRQFWLSVLTRDG